MSVQKFVREAIWDGVVDVGEAIVDGLQSIAALSSVLLSFRG